MAEFCRHFVNPLGRFRIVLIVGIAKSSTCEISYLGFLANCCDFVVKLVAFRRYFDEHLSESYKISKLFVGNDTTFPRILKFRGIEMGWVAVEVANSF